MAAPISEGKVRLGDHLFRTVSLEALQERWPSARLLERKVKSVYDLLIQIPEGWTEAERDLWILKRLAIYHRGKWRPVLLAFWAGELQTYEEVA